MTEPTAADRERAREIAMRFTLEHWRDRNLWNVLLGNSIADALAAVRAETVEQCAKIAESDPTFHVECDHGAGYMDGRTDAAQAIRSLKTGDNNV